MFDKAAQMDNIVYTYPLEENKTMQNPPKSFSSCRGILSLERKYGLDRLIAACACAMRKSVYSY